MWLDGILEISNKKNLILVCENSIIWFMENEKNDTDRNGILKIAECW